MTNPSPVEARCCEKCFDYQEDALICMNPSCECHKNHITDTNKMVSPSLDELKGWEERFDEKRPDRTWVPVKKGEESEIRPFGYRWFDGEEVHEVTDWGNLKSFISSLLDQAYRAGREDVIAFIKDAKMNYIKTGQVLTDSGVPLSVIQGEDKTYINADDFARVLDAARIPTEDRKE